MKVISVDGDHGIVQAGGLKRESNFTLLKGAASGDYVLLHAGFAIEKVKAAEARKLLKLLEKM
jgi:hydrogenase expression/formation protein HypC